MKRILIIGSGGAGKSTLARELGHILGLPVIHLDAHHWQPGWVSPSKERWREQVNGLIERKTWIMDGNFSGTLSIRLAACDTILLLDLPRRVCLARVLKRRMLARWRGRPDMAPGCPEKLDLMFLAWIWGYRKSVRPRILRLVDEFAPDKPFIHLRRRTDVSLFLHQVRSGIRPCSASLLARHSSFSAD